MDILLSVLAGDIASRFISFLVAKYQNQSTTDKLERLQWLLLRARTIVEEAEGRYISNQGMLLQLRQLTKDTYRGYYMLDTFNELHTIDAERRTKVGQSYNLKKLQNALESLESTNGDMKEFVVFLLDCPRIPRQPYSTYLFMERCMFGRQVEKEQIITFLLQPCNSCLSVLPIIGPREVGKNTLVEHVCNEERVRKRFSQIIRFNSDDLNNNPENVSFIKKREVVVCNARSLIVVELVHNMDDETWMRFYSSIWRTNGGSSKVIIISRMEEVSRLGTAQALKLKRLHRHEFWYLFRTLAFGSANPEEHQELAPIARKIAAKIKGAFIALNIFTRLLRANLNPKFWRYTLEFIRKAVKLQHLVCGEHSWDIGSKSRHYCLSDHVHGPLLLCNNGYKTVTGCLVKDELPKITADDMLVRSSAFPSEGNFELLRWQSPIPPYYSYIANCVVKKAPQVVPEDKCLKRKRGV